MCCDIHKSIGINVANVSLLLSNVFQCLPGDMLPFAVREQQSTGICEGGCQGAHKKDGIYCFISRQHHNRKTKMRDFLGDSRVLFWCDSKSHYDSSVVCALGKATEVMFSSVLCLNPRSPPAVASLNSSRENRTRVFHPLAIYAWISNKIPKYEVVESSYSCGKQQKGRFQIRFTPPTALLRRRLNENVICAQCCCSRLLSPSACVQILRSNPKSSSSYVRGCPANSQDSS